MRKQERAEWIRKRLAELYPDPQPPLHFRDPYTMLIAVLLSAQCTDERVNQVTPALFAQADTAEKMMRLPLQRIHDAIRSCGLAPQKAKAISALSRILVEQHGGAVPRDLEALEALPGVGHKTASVLVCQAFGQPAFPVDTHIHRLAQRWGLSSGKGGVRGVERDLKVLFAPEYWRDLHLQIIFYGRQHCSARGCDGTVCEICRSCYPRRRKAVQTLPA